VRQVYDGHTCNHDHHDAAPVSEDPGDLDRIVADLIKRVFDEKVKAGDVHAESWQYNTTQYWKAILQGWEDAPKYFSTAQIALLELRRNVNTFAAFKNHANIIELVQGLTDENGQPVPFSQFKKYALAISEKYNVNWLQAEFNLAKSSAQNAALWQKFQAKGGKLEYKTVGDGRVREEHRKLDGTLLPVSHPFWKYYFPPNGWKCRCFVRWRLDSAEDVAPTEIPDVIEMFRNNVGETSQIFTDAHPFIREIGARHAQEIKELAQHNTRQWERKYIGDLLKENLVGKTTKVDIEGLSASVQYSSKRLGKAISQPHENQFDKNRALLNIEQLMKDAKFHSTAENTSAWKTQVKQYHYLLIEVSGKPSYVVLEEMNDGSVYFYSIVDHLKI
jgi:SPP1 gp7 family putative phage head morphogenesis protein